MPTESSHNPAEPHREQRAARLSGIPGETASRPSEQQLPVPEIGGRRDGPEPTRFGDWEKAGRCIDF